MDKKSTLKMIADISDAKGISGFEDEAVDVIRAYSQSCGEQKEDSLRNLYIYRKENLGNRPVVLLDAHSDEVGFMVQSIRPNGTLQIIPIGGWVPCNVPAHLVWVKNAEGSYIRGVVASKPPHFMSEAERRSPLEMSSITVDVGATSYSETVEKYKIRHGAPIVPDAVFEYDDKNDTMIGKAFDCRIGCAAVVSTLQELAACSLEVDIVGAISSQEEVGVRGAAVTARTVKPAVAIVFEGCPADDTCAEEYAVQTAIKKGPMLRHIDARMITNPRFQKYALDMAAGLGIPVQDAVRLSGATNGAAIHLSEQGIPTIVIGIPVRYAHTHYGISSYTDYTASVKLACEILKRINGETIEGF